MSRSRRTSMLMPHPHAARIDGWLLHRLESERARLLNCLREVRRYFRLCRCALNWHTYIGERRSRQGPLSFSRCITVSLTPTHQADLLEATLNKE